MYSTINGTSYIAGDFGKYDGKIKDNSVRYSRNSADNYKKYSSNYVQQPVKLGCDEIDFSKKSKIGIINKISGFFKNLKFNRQMKKLERGIEKLNENEQKRTPLKFVLKYMPGNIENGNIDKQALMGYAYEELGTKEIKTKDLTAQLQEGMESFDEGSKLTAEALDVNNDGKVDIAEYSTSILVSDALSEGTDKILKENMNGIVTEEGLNKSLKYGTIRNKEAAREVYSGIYNEFNLGEAKQEFLKNKNNVA